MGANDLQIAAGKTLTVNAAALIDTGATLTFNGTASELDGSLIITGGNGNDTLTGGAFTDTLSGGIGADRLTGGLSADVLTGGAGADTFVYTSASVAASNGTTFDSITDWTSGTDKLEVTLDYSALTSALTISTTRATTTAVAGVSAAQDVLSGARGQYVYDTTNSVLLINVNNDNLFTTSDFRIGLTAASTAANTVVEGDINFIVSGGSAADVITTGSGADTISSGNGGDSITAGAGADVITGGTGADTIDGGDGADTITTGGGANSVTGGAGGDTITLGTAGTAELVVYTSATDGASANSVTAGSFDTVATFVTTEDDVQIGGALKTLIDNNNNGTLQSASVAQNALDATAGTHELIVLTTEVNTADLTTANFANVITAIGTVANEAVGLEVIIAVRSSQTAGITGIYLYQEAGTNDIQAAELTLLAVVTGNADLVHGDFIFG